MAAAHALGDHDLLVDLATARALRRPGRATRADQAAVVDPQIDPGVAVARDEGGRARGALVPEQRPRCRVEHPPAQEIYRQAAERGPRRRGIAALQQIERGDGEAEAVA